MKKNRQAGEDLDEYSQYFALPVFKTSMIVVAQDIIGYLKSEWCNTEHKHALRVQILPVQEFKEKSSFIQVDSEAMVIKPPSDSIKRYIKMIKDLNNQKE